MRGFGGGLGEEPPAVGSDWGSGGEAQLLEDGGLGQARGQPEIIGGGARANYGGAKLFVYSDENEGI